MIRISNLKKNFGKLNALKGLNLHVPPGSIFVFLGPNGAGKTTTLKMTVGLMTPDEGEILISGIDIHKFPVKAKQHIGYVPDEPHLYDKLTGLEFLEMVGRLYGMDFNTVKKKANYWIERMDMGDYINDLAEGYSHGMSQRVVFSSAMLHDPKILIVDEPMVGLDPLNSRRVKDVFREFAQNGNSVLLSTHTMGVAQEVGDVVGILNHGELLVSGSMDDIRGDKALEDVFLGLIEGTQ